MEREYLDILIVDGNRVSRKVYSRLLQEHFTDHCKILEVGSGEEGLQFCHDNKVDCMVIDWHLPDMEGLEFLHVLKAKEEHRFIPVVILTGQGDEHTAVQAMKSGAQDYLVKGTFSRELMAQAVTNAVEKVELMAELKKKQTDLEQANVELKREISERIKVEESLRLFRDLMNQSDDSLFIIDPETGRFSDFNDTAFAYLNYTREELLERSMLQIDTTLTDEGKWTELVNSLKQSKTLIYEGRHQRKDDTNFPVEVNFKYTSLRDHAYLVAVVRDITERKKVEEKLRELSNMDGLTGVHNRRYMDINLDKEWRRLARNKEPLAVIMMDVDFFKPYNDTYGHQAGDHCLQKVAGLLKSKVGRASDFIARYGGEEFIVVLPETQNDGAEYMAEVLRAGVASLEIPHVKSQVSKHVTISLGVASLVPDLDAEPSSIIEQADQALYQAKKGGRNRFVIAE